LIFWPDLSIFVLVLARLAFYRTCIFGDGGETIETLGWWREEQMEMTWLDWCGGGGGTATEI